MARPVMFFVSQPDRLLSRGPRVEWWSIEDAIGFRDSDDPLTRCAPISKMAEDACHDQEAERDLSEYDDGDIVALYAYKSDDTMTIEWEAENAYDVYKESEVDF